MWTLLSGIFLGWGLGSNDSANIFGTGVAANILKYRTAVILISVFVLMGALLEGHKPMDTVGKFSNLSSTTAFVSALAAGITVAVMSYLSLPVSTSQAIIGGLLGIGIIHGFADFGKLYTVVICWVLTPIGATIVSIVLYKVLGFLFERIILNLRFQSLFLTGGLVVAGCYGAYALGANNVANVTGVYVGSGLLTPLEASAIGGLSIASGVLTYSWKVMQTIGMRIVPMDAYSAVVSELSEAITVHIFTQVGVPVSTSQAIVGAVVGVGIVKDVKTVSRRTLVEIGIGWISTPLLSGLLSYGIIKIWQMVA
ncbi:MAG: inorganic phosphate transporter [Proteobacteria bacterium]|nr:inorganic phosphate transporter [Pseudomonadota bacterium]